MLLEHRAGARMVFRQDGLEGEHHVLGREILPVMPLHAAPQREAIRLAVRREGPFRRERRLRIVVAVEPDEPFHHLRGDVAGRVIRGHRRVERRRIGIDAEHSGGLLRREGGTRQQAERGEGEVAARDAHALAPSTRSAMPVKRRTPWSSAASSMSKSVAWCTGGEYRCRG